ncbi:MAG: DUF1786 domain-containing protein [Desulfobacteraceae bacterium]|nr:DUF1786 domain-containing protein [Desulfobacteraceae bacterium]
MSRFLIVDIGAGTMDVLYYEDGSDLHFKAVVKSPVRYVSERVEKSRGDLLLTGCEMGGGKLAGVLRERARRSLVCVTRSAALTLSHDLEKVSSWGIRLVTDEEAAEMAAGAKAEHIVLGDVRREHLERITEDFGVPFEFDYVGVCAQDHGTPPAGVSHLDYRHNVFREALEGNPFPHALVYEANGVPPTFNRLNSIALAEASLPAARCFVMDSGMAAITGAVMDTEARKCGTLLVLDVATSHTVGAALVGGELAGFFEYHTSDITAEKMDVLLHGLAEGTLEHSRVLREGGHGAYVRKAVGLRNVERIVATGPRRALVEKSRLDISFGAPLGDNMMTGTLGVLESIRRRENMPSLIGL